MWQYDEQSSKAQLGASYKVKQTFPPKMALMTFPSRVIVYTWSLHLTQAWVYFSPAWGSAGLLIVQWKWHRLSQKGTQLK